MPIIFAAVTPNHPQLKTDAASSSQTPSKTLEALKEMEGELYFMKPDTILLLTSYGSEIPETINVNIESKVSIGGEKIARTDMEFSSRMQMVMSNKVENNLRMAMVAEKNVDEHIATPLSLLLEHLPDTKVVILSTGNFDQEEHFKFGEFLRQEALESNKRIAIIATGCIEDFSSDQHSPALSPLFLEAIKNTKHEELLQVKEDVLKASHTDLFHPLAVLLGAIHHVNVRPNVMSSETLYQQDQAVINFIIQ